MRSIYMVDVQIGMMLNSTFLMLCLITVIKAQNTSITSTIETFTTNGSSESTSDSDAGLITSSTSQDKIPLYLGAYFSLGGNWDGSGILPAVEMALDHINHQMDILPEYELRMIWNDTRVSEIH